MSAVLHLVPANLVDVTRFSTKYGLPILSGNMLPFLISMHHKHSAAAAAKDSSLFLCFQ